MNTLAFIRNCHRGVKSVYYHRADVLLCNDCVFFLILIRYS